MEKQLEINIVSFDVPFPPNYGGVIDVYYKIKALHKLGVKIHLHTFEYGRGRQKKLEEICSSVHYYKRKNFFKSIISPLPFIVKSRHNNRLINNLKKSVHPILFEGLHSTAALLNSEVAQKTCFVRTHNIEHSYYFGLAKSEQKKFRQYFFQLEAKKLKQYEENLNLADKLLTISPFEQAYFKTKFGSKATYLPVFFDDSKLKNVEEPNEPFVLFHGDLRVSDNIQSALFFIAAFKKTKIPFCIASSFRNTEIEKSIEKYSHLKFHLIKNNEDLSVLFSKAAVNCIYTYQKTGIKIKLLHTLTKGKHLVTNNLMVEDTGLETLCHIIKNHDELIKKVETLLKQPFSDEDALKRKKILDKFSPHQNGLLLKKMLLEA